MDDATAILDGLDANTLYERDFYAWGLKQADLLRAGRLGELDIENMAEEIEGLAKSEKRELVSRLTVLLLHLLKWRYQPERRGRSWEASIRTQRLETEDHLADNASLKAQLGEIVARAHRLARGHASIETELPIKTFPEACPWSFQQIMDEDFWPEPD